MRLHRFLRSIKLRKMKANSWSEKNKKIGKAAWWLCDWADRTVPCGWHCLPLDLRVLLPIFLQLCLAYWILRWVSGGFSVVCDERSTDWGQSPQYCLRKLLVLFSSLARSPNFTSSGRVGENGSSRKSVALFHPFECTLPVMASTVLMEKK